MSIREPGGNRRTWGYEFQFKGFRFSKFGFFSKEEAECAKREYRAYLMSEAQENPDFLQDTKIKAFSVIINENGCMLSSTHLNGGYPVIKRNGKRTRVSRLIYELNYGPVPPGAIMRHKCDMQACINPLHLEYGSHADNQSDKVKRGRQAKGEGNGRARLTEEDVRFVLQSGLSEKELGEKFMVHDSTIRAIRQGKTWRHLR